MKNENYSLNENELSKIIIGLAIGIHRQFGPGLLESVYENILAFELRKANFKVHQQWAVPLVYEEIKLEAGFRLDLLVENKVVIEVKSIEALAPIHYAQTLTYLRLTDFKLALLINFNTIILKDGIHRIVNKL